MNSDDYVTETGLTRSVSRPPSTDYMEREGSFTGLPNPFSIHFYTLI